MKLKQKAAMFGKLSLLDHIMSLRGELIARKRGTAKRRNVKLSFADPKGKRSVVNLLNYAKKAAMFGLDARIALAIFGALSIITGAALYSAIQDAKATSVLTEMQEVGKAWEAYYLDTGTNLPQASLDDATESFFRMKTRNLVEDPGVPGWKGPYLNYELTPSYLMNSNNGTIQMHFLTDTLDWGGSNSWSPGRCTSGLKCSVWVYISGFPNEDYAKSIDAKIDSSNGADKGKFRWWYSDADKTYRYHLQMAPIKNPSD